MKHLVIFLLLAACSASAFAQFPLGGKEKAIRAYFNKHVAYASAENFKTTDGVSGIRFVKPHGIGDYTFFFDSNGSCISYVVTYVNGELDNIVTRLNATFRPVSSETWACDSQATSVTVVPPRDTDNYFRVVYLRSAGTSQMSAPMTLASN